MQLYLNYQMYQIRVLISLVYVFEIEIGFHKYII